jgi:hypothetical protein
MQVYSQAMGYYVEVLGWLHLFTPVFLLLLQE